MPTGGRRLKRSTSRSVVPTGQAPSRPVSSRSSEVPNSSRIRMRVSTFGRARPRSYRLICIQATPPSRRPNSACVRPAFSRTALILLPIVVFAGRSTKYRLTELAFLRLALEILALKKLAFSGHVSYQRQPKGASLGVGGAHMVLAVLANPGPLNTRKAGVTLTFRVTAARSERRHEERLSYWWSPSAATSAIPSAGVPDVAGPSGRRRLSGHPSDRP